MLDVHAPLARALATQVLLAPGGNRVRGVSLPGTISRKTNTPGTYDWRAAPGSAENTERVRAELELRSLGEVLRTRYAQEAHFSGYVVMQQGDALERAPRVRKDTLPWLRAEGFEVFTTCFLADVDTPRAAEVKAHRPWDENLRKELEKLWSSGAKSGPLTTCGIYLSPHGYRLVQPLEEPLPADEAEPRLRAWLESLKVAGCWENITVVKDWTRLMRAPFHRRATGAVEPGWSDYSRMRPIDPPEAPAETRSATRARKARASVALGPELDACPRAWVPVAEALGRTIGAQVAGGYRDCYLALSGALHEHGCPLEALGPVVALVRRQYEGWEAFGQNRVEIARDTARRIASGAPVAATAALRRGWPAIAAVLAEACARMAPEAGGPVSPVVARVRAQLGEAREEVPVEVATERLRATIRDAYGVVLVSGPPGLGKSEAVLWLAGQLQKIVRRARPGQRIGVTVPTHDLAAQLYARAQGRDVAAARLYGPLAHTQPDGTPTCIYHDRAEALARGGHSVTRLFCEPEGDEPCERANTCEARKGREGADEANLLIAPHELLSRVAREVGKAGTLAIDEPPSTVDVVALSLDDLAGARRHLDATLPGYARKIAPALESLGHWARHAEAGERVTFVEALARGLPHTAESVLAPVTDPLDPSADDVLAALREAPEGEQGERRGLAAPLTAMARAMCRRNAARAQEVGAATAVLLAVSRAGQVLDDVPEASVTAEGEGDERRVLLALANERMVVALRRDAGTVLLDAGILAHRAAIGRVAGYEPPYLDFAVPDGCAVERVVLATLGSTRSALVPRGVADWARIAALLRPALAWAAEDPETRQLVLVSWKVVEAGVLLALEDPRGEALAREARLVGRQRAAAVAALGPLLGPWRGKVATGHYEALRGLDHLRDADALVTLGDPRRNLGVETARAQWVGEEADGRVDALAAAELDQAHGRLRTVHRTRRARGLHVGAIVPAGWRCRTVAVRGLPEGRPATLAAMDADELVRLRGGLGMGVRELARALSAGHQTVIRYESGERAIPAVFASAVRALAASGPETPCM
mgnify:FL=1